MLFWIEVEGERVAVQVVKRKPNPYWRLAPYTIVYPTPKQRKVRDTVSIAAHRAVDGTQEDINLEVKDAFRDWDYTTKPLNKTYAGLKMLYGDQVDQVMDYINAQKRVEIKMQYPEYRKQIDMEVERLVLA